jgi:hypothetical protein
VPNEAGYSAIFVMPCSLMAATVFSEAIWQRVWASEDKKALRFGASVGCVGIIAVVFLLGFSGILATWANRVPMNYNLYLFQVGQGPRRARELARGLAAGWLGRRPAARCRRGELCTAPRPRGGAARRRGLARS